MAYRASNLCLCADEGLESELLLVAPPGVAVRVCAWRRCLYAAVAASLVMAGIAAMMLRAPLSPALRRAGLLQAVAVEEVDRVDRLPRATRPVLEGHEVVVEPKHLNRTANESRAHCASVGDSCLESKCCKAPGHQCYTKDAWWAQCMVSCIPGPNVQDQTSPFPWQCKALGERTPGEAHECSGDGEDCRETKCCKSAGSQCYRKGQFWAACRASCAPGPDLQADDWEPWSCEVLGPRTFGAAPWVAQTCAKGGESCQPKGCCAEPGHQCYTQSPSSSKCMPSCKPGMTLTPWDKPWECKEVGMRTPDRFENQQPQSGGMVAKWTVARCSGAGENCIDTRCCHAVGHVCYEKSEYWAACRPECSAEPDPDDANATWSCKTLGPRSWGLATKGYPSIYCVTLFMPSSYEGPLLKKQLEMSAGIFSCDGFELFAADPFTLGKTKDGVVVKATLIPKIPVGRSQDGTAGNAKLFMAMWDKVIASARFRNFDFTIKADGDAVVIPWRIRDHVRVHIGRSAYIVNCNKFPNSPNFPMMFGAVEVFTLGAMRAYASGSWKCGSQLPWKAWGEDFFMTHCLDYLGVGRIADFGIVGDNVCTGANCADNYKASFHPFKGIDAWTQCWTQATAR